MKAYLVRHTETEWNEESRFIGRTDLGLSIKGKERAEILADRLKPVEFERIYSSPYRRAIETANFIKINNDQKIIPVEDLKEIDFGAWEGRTIDELMDHSPEVIGRWLEDPISEVIPEGEHWSDFGHRVRSAYDDIISNNSMGNILIVSHGGPLKNILGYVLDLPTISYWKFTISHGSISVIEYKQDRTYLTLLNDYCHFSCI